jgi:hypothetical protein
MQLPKFREKITKESLKRHDSNLTAETPKSRMHRVFLFPEAPG